MQREQEMSVMSLMEAEGVAEMAREPIAKHDAEGAKLCEQAKSSDARRVVFKHAAGGHLAVLQRHGACLIVV